MLSVYKKAFSEQTYKTWRVSANWVKNVQPEQQGQENNDYEGVLFFPPPSFVLLFIRDVHLA